MTFKEADQRLGKRDSRKLANNTYIVRMTPDAIAIRLHATEVVTFRANGTITFNSGGWRTVTTKDRMNGCSPVHVYSDKGTWFANGHPFADGITFTESGEYVSGAGEDERAKLQTLNKRVQTYIAGFCKCVAENGLESPSNGDCWGCWFKADSNNEPMGYEHYLSHMDEGYYVPSLVLKAITLAGYPNPGFIWHMIQGEAARKETGFLRRVLNQHFRKIKPHLLAAA